jgi:GAF domain-containing protein
MGPERRHSLRQKVNTPAFASFDGLTGGMILDLSEEGMAMQTMAPLEADSIVPLNLTLGEPAAYLETTGYVAWADALGRAGVRFSDLPDEARGRLRDWLTENASAKSWKAPRWVVKDSAFAGRNGNGGSGGSTGVALSLETESSQDPEEGEKGGVSTTVQYEFKSLSGDLTVSLSLIANRACSITRGTGAAVALMSGSGMICRAVFGSNVPPIGTEVDVSQGFTGECIRQLRALRCDDAWNDPRTDAEACRDLGIRSILAAPILYERDLVGLLEVFCVHPYAFDDGDLAVVERLAQTAVLTLSRAEVLRSSD